MGIDLPGYRVGMPICRADPAGGAAGRPRVWRAVRTADGLPVAVKVFPPAQAPRAVREAAITATLDHPHVIAVLDVVSGPDTVALVTPLAAGGSLADLLRARLRLRWPEVLTVLIPLADALAAAHERDIVHGDLSAANVLFDRSGRPLLADLGAARAATEAGVPVAVTVTDVAPEVARGATPTPASDLFSLGSVALHCLAGSPAWPADDLQDVLIQSTAGQWPDPPDVLGPPALLEVVRRLLDPEPARRGSAGRAAVELRRVGEPEPVELVLVTDDGAVTGPAPATVIRPDAPPAVGNGGTHAGRRFPRAGRRGSRAGHRGSRAGGRTGPGRGAGTRAERPGRAAGRGRLADPAAAGFRPERRARMAVARRPVSWRTADPPGRHSRPGWLRRAQSRLARPGSPSGTAGPGRGGVWRPPDVRSRLQGATPGGAMGVARGPATSPAGLREPHAAADRPRAAPTGGAARGPWGMAAAVAVLLLVGTGAVRAGLWWAGVGTIGPATVSALPSGPMPSPPAPSPPIGSIRSAASPPAGSIPKAAPPPAVPDVPAPAMSSGAPQPASSTTDHADWLAVVAALDRARAGALIAADPALLADVYTDDSPARAADAGQIAAMVAAGYRVAAAGHHLDSATLVARDGPGTALVRVVESLPAYPVLDADGTPVARTAGSARSTIVLELVRTDTGYRISRILPG